MTRDDVNEDKVARYLIHAFGDCNEESCSPFSWPEITPEFDDDVLTGGFDILGSHVAVTPEQIEAFEIGLRWGRKVAVVRAMRDALARKGPVL